MWAVIALQAAVLLTLAVTPTDPPAGPLTLDLIWGWMHKATFYPLVALLVGGPTLTWIAWQTSGRHRAALFVAWVIFLTVLIGVFGERVAAMLRVLWWYVNRDL